MSECSKLVEDNMNLVYHIIHTNYPRYINDEDLIQEGFLALCIAAEKFDESKGIKFGTFAYKVVLNQFRMYFNNKFKELPTTSLDIEVYNDDGCGSELHELIPDSNVDQLFREMEIESFIDNLSEKEIKIITLKSKGLMDIEIGEMLGVSKQFVNKTLTQVRLKWRKENEN